MKKGENLKLKRLTMLKHTTDNEKVFISLLLEKWWPSDFPTDWEANIKETQKVITSLINIGVTTTIGEDEEKALFKAEWLLETKWTTLSRSRMFEGLWLNYWPRFNNNNNNNNENMDNKW